MTSDRTVSAIGHIRYEMKRLAECYERWYTLREGQCVTDVTDVGDEVLGDEVCHSQRQVDDLIELTLVHARAVLEFFESSRVHSTFRRRKAYSDDIVSEDFGWPAKALAIEKEIKTRIDKEIAHLTYYRCELSGEQKRWQPASFVPVLIQESEAFLKFLEEKAAFSTKSGH